LLWLISINIIFNGYYISQLKYQLNFIFYNCDILVTSGKKILTAVLIDLGSVWLCCSTCFSANFNLLFFFLLKLSAVCTFWIVLICWYQKWFLKNKKTSLARISARKAIWKATTTTLPNTLLIILHCMLTAQNGHYESARITKKKKECEMTM
jgi:hypothetical protein